MNKNAECYFKSAQALYLRPSAIAAIDGFEIKLGRKRYFNRGFIHCFNNHCSATIARDKFATNQLLEQAGFPVPKATFIDLPSFEEGRLEEIISDLKFPLVIKPTLDGRRGHNVLCNIQNIEQLKKHLTLKFVDDHFISIEEFHGNLNAYRVLIFKNKVLGVVQRFRAHITGDGTNTIEQLIALKNIQRQKGSDIFAPIMIDEEVNIRLDELGLTLNHIPEKHEVIVLCYVCNSSRGGTIESLGLKICDENKRLLIRAAKTLHLNLVGFDIECSDINLPIETTRGVIIEANANPSIRIHEQADEGIPVNVSKTILRSLIYRHPLSYLFGLYRHRRIGFYIRGFILIAMIAMIIAFFSSAT